MLHAHRRPRRRAAELLLPSRLRSKRTLSQINTAAPITTSAPRRQHSVPITSGIKRRPACHNAGYAAGPKQTTVGLATTLSGWRGAAPRAAPMPTVEVACGRSVVRAGRPLGFGGAVVDWPMCGEIGCLFGFGGLARRASDRQSTDCPGGRVTEPPAARRMAGSWYEEAARKQQRALIARRSSRMGPPAFFDKAFTEVYRHHAAAGFGDRALEATMVGLVFGEVTPARKRSRGLQRFSSAGRRR